MSVSIKFPRHLWKKLTKLAEEKGYKGNVLNYVRFLTQDVANEKTMIEEIKSKTMRDFLPMWLNSFAENLPYIRYGNALEISIPSDAEQLTITDLAEPMPNSAEEVKGSAVVIGRGPSIFNHKHVEMLAKAVSSGRYKGMVCATDGMLIECLKNGLIPDITLTVDGSSIIKKWYDHSLVKEYGSKLKLIFLVNVDHEVFLIARDAGCQIYWANALQDNWRENESWTRLHRLLTTNKKYPNGIPAITPGGCAGNCLFAIAADLFKRAPVALIGFDSGYPEGTNLEETPYFSGILETSKAVDVTPAFFIDKIFKEYYHPDFKCKAWADPVFQGYRASMLQMQNQTYPWYRQAGGTINCTEGGTIWGNDITCLRFEEFLNKYSK